MMETSTTSQQGIALVVAAVLVCINSGCSVKKIRKLEVNQVAQPQQEHIVGITTKKGEEIGFDPPGATVNKDALEAKVRSVPYNIAIQDVQRLWVERKGISAPRTIGLTVAIVAGSLAVIAVIVAATKQSCPFVYSIRGMGSSTCSTRNRMAVR
jgi:hypothetical protein